MTDVSRITVPFCGACGWDHVNKNQNDDEFCDSCGADVTRFGFGPANAPSPGSASAGSLQVSFSWTASPLSFDSYGVRHQTDGGPFTVVEPATSPVVVVAAAGEEVCFQLRGKKDGVWSDYAAIQCATALA